MREIKFRAWDQHWKRFDYGGGDVLLRAKESSKVQQFTGLKDKDGAEIYEGDIIRTLWKEILGEKYNKPQVKECPSLHPDYFHWYSELDDMVVEVIGNIYQNPELLDV